MGRELDVLSFGQVELGRGLNVNIVLVFRALLDWLVVEQRKKPVAHGVLVGKRERWGSLVSCASIWQ